MPYYMAGGFFSRIAHKVGHAAGVVGHAVVAANTKPWAFLISGGKTTDLKAAAILATSNAMSVVGAGGAGGRLQQIVADSMPAGTPSDGTPANAEIAQARSYNTPEGTRATAVLAAHHARHSLGSHVRQHHARVRHARRRRR